MDLFGTIYPGTTVRSVTPPRAALARGGRGEAAAREGGEALEEGVALLGRQCGQHGVLDRPGDPLALGDRALALVGHGDDPRATIAGGGPALGEAGALELVDRDDHRRLVEPDHVRELLLGELAGAGGGEHAVAARGEA